MEAYEKKLHNISPEALELEFVRNSLKELVNEARRFAKEKGITFEVDTEEKRERFRLFPIEGDFSALRAHVENMLPNVNTLLSTHAKDYVLDIREYNNGFHIEAVKINRSR